MAIEVPRPLVEFILLGPQDDRRQLQDSPVLGDVWAEFAQRPDARLELLVTPHKRYTAGDVARHLASKPLGRRAGGKAERGDGRADIAYLQGIVAARLSFEEVLRHVVPVSYWWSEKRIAEAIRRYVEQPGRMQQDIESVLESARAWWGAGGSGQRSRTVRGTAQGAGGTAHRAVREPMQDLEAHKRYITLAGLILWASGERPGRSAAREPAERIRAILARRIAAPMAARLKALFEGKYLQPERALVWHVSLNRTATPALARSVPAVKADAARTLFTVDCSKIAWAVIDSGIDAEHPAFLGAGGCRVRKAFDFTRIREVLSLENLDRRVARERAAALAPAGGLNRKEAAERLVRLAQASSEGRAIDWDAVEELVEIDPRTRPPGNHGTHVAGILAANGQAARQAEREGGRNAAGDAGEADAGEDDRADGICPDIGLYDFRVLGATPAETEFAIVAALQYIRYVNERHSHMTIHGANLSLSIRHDVRNFACGRTPVCIECERLVESGVVVVAAAGNRGFQNFETRDGLYEGYAAYSITDPGNAEGVITVGATHRSWPHTYGVSFFSSRGPTGDGRPKPDLVAPGERIRAPVPGNQWADLDGTSMAAPHVSGAAAMLMARYSELVGQPRRIKQVLCDSATDLGRERGFQGHGMLDVLRAFQTL